MSLPCKPDCNQVKITVIFPIWPEMEYPVPTPPWESQLGNEMLMRVGLYIYGNSTYYLSTGFFPFLSQTPASITHVTNLANGGCCR